MPDRVRVIVNDRPLRQTLTGVGHYIRQLLLALDEPELGVDAAPFFYTHLSRRDWRRASDAAAPTHGVAAASARPDADTDATAGGARAAPVAGDAPGPARLSRSGAALGHSRKPWWLRRMMHGAYAGVFRALARRYAVYHEPNHIPMPSRLATVTTVHDLSVLEHPEWHPLDRVKWYEAEFAAGVRQTRHFLAASEFTKRRMVERLALPADRITVTLQAARPAFCVPPRAQVRAALAALGAPADAFLYVGTLEPRKNVAGLLDAYSRLPAPLRRRHPLLLIGAWGWKHDALRAKLAQRGVADDVRLLGYMDDANLACLYASCRAFVWPTLYEGFGLPPLEAMACGAPVVVSDVASLPEVVGDAGVRHSPNDVESWTRALHQLAEDDAWRGELARRGLARAAEFTWARCARETAAVYRAVAASR
ncbi:MAG: glycosyltransferase family 4 protein [Phycisphaerae bacterium]